MVFYTLAHDILERDLGAQDVDRPLGKGALVVFVYYL